MGRQPVLMVIANPPLAEPAIDPRGVIINPTFEMGVANWNRYVPKNPHRISLSFNHPELDRCYKLSATDSQVFAELSDAGAINLLLELASLHPIISIKNKVVCVAIHTDNRILNYNYKAGFEPHTEYAKI